RRVAGGQGVSISQPRWDPAGRLHWVSDRTGWWNLYADDGDEGGGTAVAPMEAEFTRPDWVFGQATSAFLGRSPLLAAWTQDGGAPLGVLDPSTHGLTPLTTPFTRIDAVQASPDGLGVVAIAAAPDRGASVVAIGLDSTITILRQSDETGPGPEWIS